jgi:hypothetical protein
MILEQLCVTNVAPRHTDRSVADHIHHFEIDAPREF